MFGFGVHNRYLVILLAMCGREKKISNQSVVSIKYSGVGECCAVL